MNNQIVQSRKQETEFQLWPFSYTNEFTNNLTLEGVVCVAFDLNQFIRNCYEYNKNQKWILVTMFDDISTNELLNWAFKYNIISLIIATDTQIDSMGYFAEPECPFQDQLHTRYLQMTFVTVSTIYHTITVSVLFLISKGWVFMKPYLNRDEATQVTLTMGGIYLIYSAFYVSQDVKNVQNILNWTINIIDVAMIYVITKNNIINIFSLKQHHDIMIGNIGQDLSYSIRIKVQLYRSYTILVLAYFIYELFANGIYLLTQSQEESQTLDPLSVIFQFYFDLMITSAIMLIFRPRQWPDYFFIQVSSASLLSPEEQVQYINQQYNDGINRLLQT
eukprot:403361963